MLNLLQHCCGFYAILHSAKTAIPGVMTIREKQIIQKGIAAQSEELLQTLLSVVQDGICFLSPEYDILYQNPVDKPAFGLGRKRVCLRSETLENKRFMPAKAAPGKA